MTKTLPRICTALCLLTTPALYSCVCEDFADTMAEDNATRTAKISMELVTPLATTTTDGYENGDTYENGISTYRVYFYDTDNTFIDELTNTTLVSTDGTDHTTYRVEGDLTNEMRQLTDFRIVVLANWEHYASPAANSNIDDLCNNSDYATYTALTTDEFNLKTSGKRLPFYGVHEYTGIQFKENEVTELHNMTMLRAVAKVEIVMDNDEDDGNDNITLVSATLHNYNKTGYCAPTGVYTEHDYGQATDWATDYTGGTMHLVGDNNDVSGEKTMELFKAQDRERDADGNVTQKETWIAYVPEYDNQSTDYSYVEIRYTHQLDTDERKYNIYFAVYDDDGTTKAYTTSADANETAKRRDIHRNNLYRFNVRYGTGKLRVFVDSWDEVFDNRWTYGTMSEIIAAGEYFTMDDGAVYKVISDDEGNLTVEAAQVASSSSGQYTIPETISYLGYTYTVVGIGERCFDADIYITVISIPASVTYINDDAFEGDISLEAIIFHSETPPTCASNAFENDDTDNMILYVPTNYAEAYRNDAFWGTFQINTYNN